MKTLAAVLCLAVCGCAHRRYVSAPSTAAVRQGNEQQRALAVESAANLKVQAEQLERASAGNSRAQYLARRIEHKATLLLEDFR